MLEREISSCLHGYRAQWHSENIQYGNLIDHGFDFDDDNALSAMKGIQKKKLFSFSFFYFNLAAALHRLEKLRRDISTLQYTLLHTFQRTRFRINFQITVFS